MDSPQRGRFAPSPTGRMQLGNVWAAMLSRTSVKSGGGVWVLRHEDLDAQRSRTEFAKWIEDDLQWLGLTWDEGGLEEKGACGPYRQSLCAPLYGAALKHLHQQVCCIRVAAAAPTSWLRQHPMPPTGDPYTAANAVPPICPGR